jgi:hypothetical protein
MKFDLQRAFPYPVLRPESNDYIDGDFQTEATFRTNDDSHALCVDVMWTLSVPEIQELIDSNQASFVLIISCRATFLRHTEQRNESEFSVFFEAGQLIGEIKVFSFIATKEKIDGFKCEWVNKEWGDTAFSFEPGALLAMEKPREIYLDKDLTKKITSVFRLVQDDNMDRYKWKIDADDDVVKIRVNSFMKEKIDLARNSEKNKSILLNSIYFGAVMQCITFLKSEAEEYDNYRWAKIMKYQIEELSSFGKEESIIAQDLLYSPLKKLETYVFGIEDL